MLRVKRVSEHRVEIRLAIPADSAAISEVLLEAFSTYRSEYTPEAFEIVTPDPQEVEERFTEGPMWVAVKDGSVIGTVSVVPEPEWLYIRSMAISPGAQGQGIGHKLLDVVEEYAVENVFDQLFLYTTYFSVGAIELYEKHGFIRGRDTTAQEWYGTPGLAMDKKLERKTKQNVVGS
jgi:N-acetylglutamate synthase-like GNAT family acetyltransferase